jgi:hypothetical protein
MLGNNVRLCNIDLVPRSGPTASASIASASIASSLSVAAVVAEDTSVEVALELEGTSSSLLPSPEAGEVGTDSTPPKALAGATGGARLGGIPPCVMRPPGLVRAMVRVE